MFLLFAHGVVADGGWGDLKGHYETAPAAKAAAMALLELPAYEVAHVVCLYSMTVIADYWTDSGGTWASVAEARVN